MLDHFLEVAYEKTSEARAKQDLTDTMAQLPEEELRKIASGGLSEIGKEAFYGSDCGWLDKFKGTALFDKALELEQAELEQEVQQTQQRAENSERYRVEDAARDQLRVQRKMLELELARAESGGGAPEGPGDAEPGPAPAPAPAAAPPAAPAPAPGPKTEVKVSAAKSINDMSAKEYKAEWPGYDKSQSSFARGHLAVSTLGGAGLGAWKGGKGRRVVGALLGAGLGAGSSALGSKAGKAGGEKVRQALYDSKKAKEKKSSVLDMMAYRMKVAAGMEPAGSEEEAYAAGSADTANDAIRAAIVAEATKQQSAIDQAAAAGVAQEASPEPPTEGGVEESAGAPSPGQGEEAEEETPVEKAAALMRKAAMDKEAIGALGAVKGVFNAAKAGFGTAAKGGGARVGAGAARKAGKGGFSGAAHNAGTYMKGLAKKRPGMAAGMVGGAGLAVGGAAGYAAGR